MMTREICFVFLFCVIIARGEVIPQCGKNEIYYCGSVCVETCDYKPKFCIEICRFGCHCKEGYVRQSNKTGSPCIKREDCKQQNGNIMKKCGFHEEFVECANPCPLTCDFWRYPVPKTPIRCLAPCRPGCVCKEGFYRSDSWKCVPREQCCEENEKFNTCGATCVETCDFKPTFCTKQCVAGCFCKNSQFIRQDNSTNSPCIDRNECDNCNRDNDPED